MATLIPEQAVQGALDAECPAEAERAPDTMTYLDPARHASVALDAVPDGWAKVDGKWVELARFTLPDPFFEDLSTDQQDAVCDWPKLYSVEGL